uniref:YgjP-like metallopeptidase domain-containing protein n=1 Tax=Magnetococcus massalia (strain MO-1) TaxID=451514 RepID=A0A1S7LNE1_MAGMO|nr:Conserved protein of unknown function [Candidatus Magnetococcus massalia]
MPKQSASQWLQLDDFEMPVEIKPSNRARRIRITVGRCGVSVTLPKRVPLHQAEAFLLEKRRWVHSHWRKRQQEQQEVPQWQRLEEGCVIPLWDNPYTLKLRSQEVKKVTLTLHEEGSERVLEAQVNPTWLPAIRDQALRTALRDLLKATLRQEIDQQIALWAPQYGFAVKGIRIRPMRSRWGSCSAKGWLNFNRHLVHGPRAVCHYVIAHELCHLHHPHHGASFWQAVAQIDGAYQTHRNWLKSHGHRLQIQLEGEPL